jgi:ABC-2 type transport system ATP-binding protein
VVGTTSPALAVEASGLAKTYRGWWGRSPQIALDGVDLTVPRGSIFGLIGLNGAGKTTFIKSMLAVVRPSGGRVRVLGGDPEDPALRKRIGYLPERLFLPRAWSARAYLRSVARLKGHPPLGEEIERLLERVGLAADAGRRIGGYSKGMRQRLGLAAALLGGPELLILDEPTDGIDPLGRLQIRGLLAEERRRGVTIFLNSHLLAETERICDRIGILHRGRVLLEGPLDALAASEARWEVQIAARDDLDREALRAAGLTPLQADRWAVDAADPESLNRALDRARAAGALLIGLSPATRDLEEILAQAVESKR